MRVAPFILVLCLLSGAGYAQHDARPARGVLSLLPEPQSTGHSVTVGGQVLGYQAKAATLSLLSGEGDVTAEIFYVAYTLRPRASRPGASGDLRLQRRSWSGVRLSASRRARSAHHRNTRRADSCPPPRNSRQSRQRLDMTDLVFVDPVGTGYSRTRRERRPRIFGASSRTPVAWALHPALPGGTGRTASPVFLAGESYGGFRAALLARTLQEDVGIARADRADLAGAGIHAGYGRTSSTRCTGHGTAFAGRGPPGRPGRHRAGAGRAAGRSGALCTRRLPGRAGQRAGGGRQAASRRVAQITGLPLDLVERISPASHELFTGNSPAREGNILSAYDGNGGRTADLAPGSPGNGPDPVLDRSVPVLT